MDPEVWEIIPEITTKLDPDPGHAEQVCRLSLMLFDELQPIHGLGNDEKNLLKAAALLHDIGWSIFDKPHHKASRDLILADSHIPFSKKERKQVALIARYHRKTSPKEDHAIYSTLNADEQRSIRYCAGILRIADVLDRSHQSLVQSLTCQVTDGEICIRFTGNSGLFVDSSVFSEKSNLLETITNRRIKLICT